MPFLYKTFCLKYQAKLSIILQITLKSAKNRGGNLRYRQTMQRAGSVNAEPLNHLKNQIILINQGIEGSSFLNHQKKTHQKLIPLQS